MEITQTHQLVPVVESTQPSAARFLTRDLAASAGFDEADSYRAGLVTTELATNLVKHAQGGEILVRLLGRDPDSVIEVMAIDRGPGIRDVQAALVDGHSTSGSPGSGLGAVRRLADAFDIHSAEGRGTVILARVARRRHYAAATGSMEFAGVSVSMAGEPVSGDAWRVRPHSDGALVAIADGLGHGVHACEAAVAAMNAFVASNDHSPAAMLKDMHSAARHTRGAAAAVAHVRVADKVVAYGGVGNISAVILYRDELQRHAVSHSGTLGHEARLFREYLYPWDHDATLIMYSDGLTSHWSAEDLRGMARRHPAVIAAVLYRDFSRRRDDVTVVVGRERG